MPKTKLVDPEKPKESEADLCAKFAVIARQEGFKVYAETADFDLLLVAGDACKGFKSGDQIGVHAKLRANIPVLWQALPRSMRSNSPHYYAILVPKADDMYIDIARQLKVTTIEGDWFAGSVKYNGRSFQCLNWYRFEPRKPCWVPDCEVHDMPAGVPSPQQLTKWKLAAIKLCLLCEERGYLLSSDFLQAEISMMRWRQKGWIVPGDFSMEMGKRMRRYTLNNDMQPPHLLYAAVTAALVAKKQAAG